MRAHDRYAKLSCTYAQHSCSTRALGHSLLLHAVSGFPIGWLNHGIANFMQSEAIKKTSSLADPNGYRLGTPCARPCLNLLSSVIARAHRDGAKAERSRSFSRVPRMSAQGEESGHPQSLGANMSYAVKLSRHRAANRESGHCAWRRRCHHSDSHTGRSPLVGCTHDSARSARRAAITFPCFVATHYRHQAASRGKEAAAHGSRGHLWSFLGVWGAFQELRNTGIQGSTCTAGL